jgi:hypothetical protein
MPPHSCEPWSVDVLFLPSSDKPGSVCSCSKLEPVRLRSDLHLLHQPCDCRQGPSDLLRNKPCCPLNGNGRAGHWAWGLDIRTGCNCGAGSWSHRTKEEQGLARSSCPSMATVALFSLSLHIP